MAVLSAAIALTAVLVAGEASPPREPPEPEAAKTKVTQLPPGAPSPSAELVPGDQRESPAALLRRSMAAYGGERARVRLGRVRVLGKVTSPLHPGESGRLTRVFSRSSRLRMEVAFPGGDPEVRVLDGARAFRYGEPAPAPVAATLQLHAARLDLPAMLLEWEQRVLDLGEVAHEGQKVRVLGLEIATGLRVEAGIDPRSGRILYARCVARNGPRQTELFTVYRDFRVVDGVLVPFREEGWANGEPTGDVELTTVEFPDDVPDATFEP